MLLGDDDQHRRHRAGRTADLERGAAERADNESSENGSDESGRRSGTAGDAEGKREGQGDGGDRQPGDEIALGVGARVIAELIAATISRLQVFETA